MLVKLIGPGDIDFHYFQLLKISKKKLQEEIENIARVLKETNVEIALLPDRGISFEIAKKYKEIGGKKVYGTVPLSDKDFGIAHLTPYLEAEVNGKKIIDEIINTENWYKQDLTCCLFGDVVLMLGNSLGALGELVYGYYLYKLFLGYKPGVNQKKERIHPKIRAGGKIPFSTIIYKPFFMERLNKEIEKYIKRTGKIYYAKNSEQLRKILKKFNKDYENKN